MTKKEREARLKQLDEEQMWAEYTLKKLDNPSGALEYAWWLASWFSSSRGMWRRQANRTLSKIAAERKQLLSK